MVQRDQASFLCSVDELCLADIQFLVLMLLTVYHTDKLCRAVLILMSLVLLLL